MSFEIIVRPATVTPVLKPGQTSTEPVIEQEEAYIEWGDGPLGMADRGDSYDGGYNYNPDTGEWEPDPGTSSGSSEDFNWEDNFDTPPPPETTPKYLFNEIERKVHEVKVAQEGKPENYVMVEVIDAISFDSPFGIYIFTFNNPK